MAAATLPLQANREETAATGIANARDSLAWTAYERHFSCVWRALRRLGVPEAKLDDALQDVFMVVHRRAREFNGSSSLRTWVLGITLRVAANVRRGCQREDARFVDAPLDLPAASASPEQLVAEREALRTLYAVLDLMKPQHREVLVLVDMEQLTVVEAARALAVNTSSCYKRLNAARGQFEREVQRHQASARWRRS